MKPRTHVIEGPASLAQVRRCAQVTARVLRDWGFPAERIEAWELAVSEMGTNVCRHGYPPDRRGPLRVELHWDNRSLSISVCDRGVRFDPSDLAAPSEPDPDDPATWPEGGLGLMLVRSAGDELRYRRRGDLNTLTLVTALPLR